MSYELTLNIAEDSPEGQNIQSLVEAQHISREEAARKLLSSAEKPSKASAEALSFLGAGREDAALIDEVAELVMRDRERHNAEPPRV